MYDKDGGQKRERERERERESQGTPYCQLEITMIYIYLYTDRRTRHAGHCWKSKDELVSDVLLWTTTYDQAKAGRPARTYIQQLCEDTGCNPEDLPDELNDREKWREMVRDIHAGGTTWWWWWCTDRIREWEEVRKDVRQYFSLSLSLSLSLSHTHTHIHTHTHTYIYIYIYI